ncbi:hypothetical protein MIR68_009054 [Amoeboaphelidium protococcarum]|nr:hypothetical protein MIR68_009054 [Amoeboaphelidium protococcarum]
MNPPNRPDKGGSKGRQVTILANVFKATLPKGAIHFYDVTIVEHGAKTPEAPKIGQKGVVLKNPMKPAVNREILNLVAKQFAKDLTGVAVAYDGKSNAYTTKPLPFEERNFEVTMQVEGREKTFTITMKAVKVVQLSVLADFIGGKQREMPMEALTALDVIMAAVPSDKWVPRGRNFYNPQQNTRLGGGVEAWSGYFQSLRPVQSGLVLNLDVSASAFYKHQPVLDLLCEVWGLRSQADLAQFRPRRDDIMRLKKIVRHLKVQLTHRSDFKRTIRVMDVSQDPVASCMFNADGKTISVADYFRDTYNVQLRYPNLPCFVCGANRALFPMEICTVVPSQPYAPKLDADQVASMIKFTATRPGDRIRRIEDGFRDLGCNSSAQLADIGLNIDNRLSQVKARVLDPPTILYKDRKVVEPREASGGSWNMRGRAFIDGVTVNNWGVIVVGTQRDAQPQKVQYFAQELAQMGRNTGVPFKNPRPEVVYASEQPEDILAKMQQLKQRINARIDFILFMVRGSAAVYGAIKRLCDSELGVASQCMLMKHSYTPKPQYMANLLLKINSKLGGQNARIGGDLPGFDRPTILIGIDVTHPTGVPRSATSVPPSIVGVVGSMDRYASQYSSIIDFQNGREENVTRLSEMVKTLLRRFFSAGGVKPERLIIFRDGVSEGQFGLVFKKEVQAIQSACFELDPNYKPPVTFIITQKRHHIRLFPAGRNEGDRSGNVMPGTVVDSEICHPVEYDFYLNSHSGIQGTNRPCHYHVLLDQNNFSSDKLQELVYKLCFTYSRCTRSVSIPPPIFYADLLAYRARLLSKRDLWSGSDTQSTASAGSDYRSDLLPINQALANVLFFV